MGWNPDKVAPLVGAWIEIQLISRLFMYFSAKSLLSWERGLKFIYAQRPDAVACVAPLVGAWIEILKEAVTQNIIIVAPLVGAWIEMALLRLMAWQHVVAPLVGAWIEIGTDRALRL